MRSDALRRRHEIVAAARTLFAAQGADTALESIAAEAGVGIATLYRNFPSRGALAEEVALSIMADIREAAAAAATEGVADPADPEGARRAAQAWERFVHRLVVLDLGALRPTLAGQWTGEMSEAVRTAQEATGEDLEAYLDRVRSAGLLRPDFTSIELMLAVGNIRSPQPDVFTAAVPALMARLTAVLLAGLRPDGTDLPS